MAGTLEMGLFQFHSQEQHRLLLFYCGYTWQKNFAIICTISCNYGISIYLVHPRNSSVYSAGQDRKNQYRFFSPETAGCLVDGNQQLIPVGSPVCSNLCCFLFHNDQTITYGLRTLAGLRFTLGIVTVVDYTVQQLLLFSG